MYNRVYYFTGSAKSFYDLSRVQVESSIAVYILGDEVTASLRKEEDAIFLSCLSVIKYLHHHQAYRQGQERIAPRLITKLTSSARTRSVLENLGVDVCLSVQVNLR